MILIFGGTTEGRKAVQVVDQAGKAFYYSTRGNLQQVVSLHGIRLTGTMDAKSMKAFCMENSIKAIIDAAHPFAIQLHQTIADVSLEMNIPVIRYERMYPIREDDIYWCKDYEDAIIKLTERKVSKLLALTGVQTISKLKPFWEHTETWFRILNREESLSIAQASGFAEDHLLYYDAEANESEIIQSHSPDAILLKESGLSGGFVEKIKAARKHHIPVFALCRPAMPDNFIVVNGEHGLRRIIEQLLPDFYHLHTGVTTGTCATAAAIAALNTLLTNRKQTFVPVTLPNGETIHIPIKEVNVKKDRATAIVTKDAGDDADITNGIEICATVRILPDKSENNHLIIQGGEGIGIVTLPGLGLPVGASAINLTPQKMIRENLRKVCEYLEVSKDIAIEVTLFVPKGAEIAEKTFNPRLGISGGISIIGNSGIVKPFSTEAFVDSIRKSMEVARANSASSVILNSGAKSEKYLRARYPELAKTAFVQYGNYIGESLKIASELGFQHIVLGLMIGKAVKLAEGHLDTHSKKTTMNKQFLIHIAKEMNYSADTIQAISDITLARELWTILPPQEAYSFIQKLKLLCHTHCEPLLGHVNLTVYLINERGELF